MNKAIATKVFESLASGIRLDVWRLLVKSGLEGMVAGQLASELDIAPNTLSFHLKAMLHAGLLSVEQEGRFCAIAPTSPDAGSYRLPHRGVLRRSSRGLRGGRCRVPLCACLLS